MYMKIKKIFSAVLCSVMLVSALMPVSVMAAPTGASQASQPKSKENMAKWPEGPSKKKLSCDSAIVMELSSGLILYNQKMHKQQYPASITKILTTWLAAENCSASEVVTFSREAAYSISPGDSTVYTDPGEKMTMEQCLYAIMLQSANEVCYGVAEYVAGSEKKFVKMMNQKVQELGLEDTHFNNTNGLPDTKHYTSAYDMAMITRGAMANPVFRAVAGVRSYVMPKTNTHKKRFWSNHHEMINGDEHPEYEYKYCIGGKTGYTSVARSTLVTCAEKDGMELVCVVMKAGSAKSGEPNTYTDTISLLNYGFEKYRKYTLDAGTGDLNKELFNNYDSYFDTEQSPVHLAGEASIVLPAGIDVTQAKQKVAYDNSVTLKEGDNVIGCVTYTYGGKTVGSTDIIYTKTAEDVNNHLDAASRQVVGQEIQDIRATEKSDEKKANLWKSIKRGVTAFFQYRVVQFILLVLAAGLVIVLFVFLFRHVHLPRFRRRRRSSSGYRNRRAKKNDRRRSRSYNSSSAGKSSRRRRRSSRNYVQRTPKKQKNRRPGLQYSKRHKNTRESFGKNFFDF